MLDSALGTPLGFDQRTLENLSNLNTTNDDVICVRMYVLRSRPTIILASLDSRNEALAKVHVIYLFNFEACDIFHQISHKTSRCAHLKEVWNSDCMKTNGWCSLGSILNFNYISSTSAKVNRDSLKAGMPTTRKRGRPRKVEQVVEGTLQRDTTRDTTGGI
ncbi:hypothetical protein POM88_050499 [Heracleum sosnowskyi]|uniref:Uncharacterized protein n=1 Tax=Heracleum sosnowskyi TaxID=360622 RepID=A0AAD8M2P8_9APIA|nr:hypothetical protein POM88_050499 [Heracleum sosnowskyi]